jgi:hypothetical protein
VWIYQEFPHIQPNSLRITSCATQEYNCIAWAAGDNTRWWCNLPGYRWSNSCRNQTIESLITTFTEIGYEICDEARLEEGLDKVALYAKEGNWTHASRQLPDGRWTSKLGFGEDIEHATPEDLSGDLYGEVYCIMKKVRL